MTKAKNDMDSWHHLSQSFERLQTANRPRAKKKAEELVTSKLTRSME